VSVRRATPSTRIVRVALDGAAFDYKAGQAAKLAPEGAAEPAFFSIASAPEDTAADGTLEFLVKYHAGDRWGSEFEPLRRRQPLDVEGPFGSFVFPEHPKESRFLFIAGGTGIAPIRSMLRHASRCGLAAEPSRPGPGPRPLSVFYSARTPKDFAYATELRTLERRGEISLVMTATREFTPRWKGKRGRIAAGELALLVDDPATLCFVCGPAAMVAEVPVLLQELGIERSRIRAEDW
jgi:CDP-4-dehydro-6-deoxyglucose reductase